jgi:HEPN domain-containing protein
MSESEQILETRRWLKYAEEDLIAAEQMARQDDIAPRQACWLAQQSAEKAIKAVLVYLQIKFPKKHDLDALRNQIPDGWQIKIDYPDLSTLSEWAVEARYPGDWPEALEKDAQAATEQARGILLSIQTDLNARNFK